MIHRLEYVEIVVKDLDAALEWYSRVLGFRLIRKITTGEDGRWCQLEISSGDNRLALWQPPSTPSNPGEKRNPSFIPVFAVQHLREFVEELERKDEHSNPKEIRERVGYLITSIYDLEGNELQLLEVTRPA